MKIFKYPLATSIDSVELLLPTGSTILSVKEQNKSLCLWALVDENSANDELYNVFIIGTGNPMSLPDGAIFIDTAVIDRYSLVLHVFYKKIEE